MHWIDPTQLPETEGTVDRLLLNPHGKVDGLLLTDGTEANPPISRLALTGDNLRLHS
jgi:hypothetical protein